VQVELIGRGEKISDEELLLLKTAALFHDTGFTEVYKDHEEKGVEIAAGILPLFDYSEEQIQKINELIMVTKLPPRPKNLLEQIICDADLDYLGRVDFIPVSGNLFRELAEHKIIEDNLKRWNQIQITFIEKHQYFTETAKRLRDVNKNIQLEAIRKLVEENN
jgi:adenylate cyclase